MQVPVRWSLHGMQVIFQDGLRPLGLFAFAESLTSGDFECSGGRSGLSRRLARLVASCQKVQLCPFEHCPMAFHCHRSPCPLRT